MQVADLLRLDAAGKAQGLVEQQKIGQTQQQIEQTKTYQTESSRLRGMEVKHGADSLAAQIENNQANQALRGMEVKHGADSLAAQIENNQDNQALRGREVIVSEGKLRLEESLKDTTIKEADARAAGNIAQADYHSAQAAHQKTVNKLVDSFISGDQKSDVGEAVAKKALGLPIDSEAQKRLRLNDMSAVEVQLLDELKVNSPETFKIVNGNFLNNAPDSLDRFYIWNKGGWANVIQVPLPAGKTLGDVRKKAVELGQSLEKTMRQIYDASKKKK